MKHSWFRYGLCCLMLTLFLFRAVSEAETTQPKGPGKAPVEGPRLSILEPRFDIGEVSPNGKAVHIFKIRNTGTETLHIKGLKAG